MKKIGMFLTMILFMVAGINTQAQNPSDYFKGDWKVVIIGTPNGDAEMIMHLDRVDGKLKGEMRNEEMPEAIEIDRIEEKETSINVFYFAAGYDISMSFEKVDENNIKGSLLGMFTANGTRVIE